MQGCIALKSRFSNYLCTKQLLIGTFFYPVHLNLNIALNHFKATLLCILLEQQSYGPWISLTSSTELKGSFLFQLSADLLQI